MGKRKPKMPSCWRQFLGRALGNQESRLLVRRYFAERVFFRRSMALHLARGLPHPSSVMRGLRDADRYGLDPETGLPEVPVLPNTAKQSGADSDE